MNLFKVANWHVACHIVQIFHCAIALDYQFFSILAEAGDFSNKK